MFLATLKYFSEKPKDFDLIIDDLLNELLERQTLLLKSDSLKASPQI